MYCVDWFGFKYGSNKIIGMNNTEFDRFRGESHE